MSPETFHLCELDTDTKTSLKMYLFKNVKNVETVRNNVIKGVWSCVIVNPSLILDPFQIAVAANRAVVSQKMNTMVTRTVYGEVLYNLSLSKNIAQSLSKFGIEKGNNLLVGFLLTAETDTSADIVPQIEGEMCPITELSSLTNMTELKSAYKLNNMSDDSDLLDIIVSRMVTKNFISH